MLKLTPQGVDNTNQHIHVSRDNLKWEKQSAFAVKSNSVPVQTPVVVALSALYDCLYVPLPLLKLLHTKGNSYQ